MKTNYFSYSIIFSAVFIFSWWAHLYFGHYDINIALKGWSALDFSNSIVFPQNFTDDYPGGAGSTGKSLLSWVYPLLQRVGILPEHTLAGMIALEILVFICGAFFLLNTLFQRSPPAAYLALAIVFLLSWVRYPNLARFGTPHFHGQFYGFADGLRLLAIALFLRRRYTSSLFALAIGFVVHPLKGLFGYTFLVGASLAQGKNLFRRTLIIPLVCFAVFTVIWVWFWLGVGKGGEVMSSADFFRYSPLLNSHWYPQNLGILEHNHLAYLTPFVSAILLGGCILVRQDQIDFPKYEIGFGILCLLIVTVIGVTAAWFEVNVLLVKSCFQRSSILVLSVVTILVIGQIYRDLESGQFAFTVLAASSIAAAFVSRFSWPVFTSLGYAVWTLVQGKKIQAPLKWPLTLFLCGSVMYLFVMWFFGFMKLDHIFYPNSYYNLRVYSVGLVVILVFCWTVACLYPEKNLSFHVWVLTFLVCLGGINWAIRWRTLPALEIVKGEDYKAVQKWAQKNTDKRALFMVDPCRSYGWRDYSVRSSFGTIQEWYKTAWLYSGDSRVFIDGLSRAQSLGLDIDNILPRGKDQGPSMNFQILCIAAREAYYNNDAAIVGLTKEYGIDYFVFEKDQSDIYGPGPQLPIAFENKSYRVLKAK